MAFQTPLAAATASVNQGVLAERASKNLCVAFAIYDHAVRLRSYEYSWILLHRQQGVYKGKSDAKSLISDGNNARNLGRTQQFDDVVRNMRSNLV